MLVLLLLDRCRRTRREAYGLLRERYRVFATYSIFAAFKELRRRQVDLIVVRTADGDAFADQQPIEPAHHAPPSTFLHIHRNITGKRVVCNG